MGKTDTHGQGALPSGKHPHERGEDLNRQDCSFSVPETPPRAWGRLDRVPPWGNTPTSVGKTSGKAFFDRVGEKHPHERGEDIFSSSRLIAVTETPPRAWGRHDGAQHRDLLPGNTPTSVGKTYCLQSGVLTFEKHPHERGEDSQADVEGYEQQKHPHERGEDRDQKRT